MKREEYYLKRMEAGELPSGAQMNSIIDAIEELEKKCLEREAVYKRGYDNGHTIEATRLEELEKKVSHLEFHANKRCECNLYQANNQE